MRLNADFDQRVVIRPGDAQWVPSPMAGVERLMLDRIGGEVARATSLVRYAPGSRFSAHTHGGGEEYFVLEGVFSDESGDYPAGTYVRNPIGTAHAPHSEPGAVIFVKLHQFDKGDTVQKSLDMVGGPFQPTTTPGLTVRPLHRFASEVVAVYRLEPGAVLNTGPLPGGQEIFVLQGSLGEGAQTNASSYAEGTWIRTPPGARERLTAWDETRLWVKRGHLHAALKAA